MCHELFHQCRYCPSRYTCNLDDIACPSINEDDNRNMCPLCERKLELKLEQIQFDQNDIDLSVEDLLLKD